MEGICDKTWTKILVFEMEKLVFRLQIMYQFGVIFNSLGPGGEADADVASELWRSNSGP